MFGVFFFCLCTLTVSSPNLRLKLVRNLFINCVWNVHNKRFDRSGLWTRRNFSMTALSPGMLIETVVLLHHSQYFVSWIKDDNNEPCNTRATLPLKVYSHLIYYLWINLAINNSYTDIIDTIDTIWSRALWNTIRSALKLQRLMFYIKYATFVNFFIRSRLISNWTATYPR